MRRIAVTSYVTARHMWQPARGTLRRRPTGKRVPRGERRYHVKTLVPTSQETQFVSILTVNRLVLHKTVDIYCENQTKHMVAQCRML